MKSSDREIGARLRLIRETHKLSQTTLGRMLNRSKQTISSWEVGRASLNSAQFVQLAQLFDVDLNWLLMGRRVREKERRSLN